MPWTAADAKSHTKEADTPAKQKAWAKIANSALKQYDGDEGKAIAVANAAVAKMGREEEDVDRMMEVERRFADIKPASYNRAEHTADAVLSMGSPVARIYGMESLRITPAAVDLSRMEQGGIPLLDHHKQDGLDSILGRISDIWFKRGALMGRVRFAQTPRGQMAEGMMERGEVAGVSIGYRVDEWRITDADGNVVDPDKDRLRWDDKLNFEATRWQLFEASMVGVPADGVATFRSFGSGVDRLLPDEVDELAKRAVSITKRFGDVSITYDFQRASSPLDDIRARMRSRQAIAERMFK
jgi:hypothetical protein